MLKQNYNVLGVMSGTSLDGIDLAHILFSVKGEQWDFEILEVETIPYAQNWIEILKKAVDFSDAELQELNQNYTDLLGEIIKNFILKNNLQQLDFVSSHGHTILHQPQNGFTLQIGNLPKIATIIKQKIVCDFRVQDVQLGGQGAPLVPIGDRILFSNYDYCLNLGGFSNISFEENGNRIAFDISPVNTVLNFYASKLGFDYDDKGDISKSGQICSELLNNLNKLDFYQKNYPKSLGFEFVKTTILPFIEKFSISSEDKLRTFTEHIAIQISEILAQKTGSLFITGGGAYNLFLIERIKYYLPNITIEIPNKKTIEFKEAVIFGLLGILKIRNEINVLSSVTGAKMDHCSGIVFL